MRILIASAAYAPAKNGQAVFTTNLAEGLAKRGHKVMVMVDSFQKLETQISMNGVQVVELKSIGLNVFHSAVNFTPFPGPEVRRIFDRFQPDIVHIQDHYPISRAAVHEARKRRIKVIGSNHFVPENLAPYVPGASTAKPVFEWVLWQWMLDVFKRVDVITAQSNAATDLIKEQGLDLPILPISCGIDLHEFRRDPAIDHRLYQERYGISAEKKTFLYLGRVDGEKRIDLLIEAMHRLNRDDIQLVVAGKGRAEEQLHLQAEDLQNAGKVVFTGFIPPEDLPGLLNSVDVFVMPSEAELLSISTLEAMACERPVLLADALALPELVRIGQNGYLFRAGNVEDLSAKMNMLAEQADRWETMGEVSREIAGMHSLNRTIQRFETLYLQLLSHNPVMEVKHNPSRTVSSHYHLRK
jgi:1,2-diacylglycerol 3-alpha-glucosyltransferase